MTPEERAARKAARRWTLADAQAFLNVITPDLIAAGFHVGLTGSVLLKSESPDDIDVIVYPYDKSKPHELQAARDVLRKHGCRLLFDREDVREFWQTKGSTDTKHVEKWWAPGGSRIVDVFFLS